NVESPRCGRDMGCLRSRLARPVGPGQHHSAGAHGTKLTGLGALLNQQSEIRKGRLAFPSERDLDNEPDQNIPGK
ncbi:hypothetical protein P7K49_027000, partial [Saguinus oedipus]